MFGIDASGDKVEREVPESHPKLQVKKFLHPIPHS